MYVVIFRICLIFFIKNISILSILKYVLKIYEFFWNCFVDIFCYYDIVDVFFLCWEKSVV